MNTKTLSHAQAQFDEVTGEELLAELGSAPPPDAAAETEGEHVPRRRTNWRPPSCPPRGSRVEKRRGRGRASR